jgi:hypothetical protein
LAGSSAPDGKAAPKGPYWRDEIETENGPADYGLYVSAVGRFSSAGGVADLQAAIAAGVAAYRAGAVTR